MREARCRGGAAWTLFCPEPAGGAGPEGSAGGLNWLPHGSYTSCYVSARLGRRGPYSPRSQSWILHRSLVIRTLSPDGSSVIFQTRPPALGTRHAGAAARLRPLPECERHRVSKTPTGAQVLRLPDIALRIHFQLRAHGGCGTRASRSTARLSVFRRRARWEWERIAVLFEEETFNERGDNRSERQAFLFQSASPAERLSLPGHWNIGPEPASAWGTRGT